MSVFNPKDKVIKCDEKDAKQWGTVLDIAPSARKPGHIAVYFQRQVWIKPENLMLLSEWKAQQKQQQPQKSIKDYWISPR